MKRRPIGKKITIDGILFDSLAEGQRYTELRAVEAAGKISELICHPKWDLIENPVLLPEQIRDTVYSGKKMTNKLTFEADFAYLENGRQIVEDVKGKITKSNYKFVLKEAWLVRFKMWLSLYGEWNEFRIIQK